MSFILDALKKSESEHQRQAGPALFEVKVAPPRHRLAPWAVALGALLAINLVVVGWMLTRGSSTGAREASQTTAAAAEEATAPRTAALASSSNGRQASSGAAPAGTSKTPGVRTSTAADSPGSDRSTVPQSAAVSAQASDSGGTSGYDSNPADFAPAVEPAENAPAGDNGEGSAVRASDGSLPSYREAASVPGADLPALRLDLHVYDARPDRRFVFLNMVKVRQGQSLPNGVRVERITPNGVVLSYGGKRFLLQRR